MKKDLKFFWTLFISTFTLSAFTFGGGYVIVPLMRKKFVETLGWIDEEEMLDLIAIAQSAPGPIAVNSSIIIGYRLAGIPGALVTTFGTVLPPMVILSAISQFYTAFRDNVVVSLVLKGMGIGVAAVIVDVSTPWPRALSKPRTPSGSSSCAWLWWWPCSPASMWCSSSGLRRHRRHQCDRPG